MEPFLFASESGKIMRLKLLGEDVLIRIGERRCIGRYRNGRLVQCPQNTLIENESQCSRCRLEDDFSLCISCNGSECLNDKQRRLCKDTMYYVYLAAFDSILKVGISNERRLLERLIEQGADFGAKVAAVRDGMSVRVIEQEISRHLKITDKVRGHEKQKRIFGSPNAAIGNISSAILMLRERFGDHLVPPEIYDLREYYRIDRVPYAPEKLSIEKGAEIDGTVVAAKGNIVIFSNRGHFLSFNMHEIVGRELELLERKVSA